MIYREKRLILAHSFRGFAWSRCLWACCEAVHCCREHMVEEAAHFIAARKQNQTGPESQSLLQGRFSSGLTSSY
jgi:hypothetical protein